jgi:hypothetical protein
VRKQVELLENHPYPLPELVEILFMLCQRNAVNVYFSAGRLLQQIQTPEKCAFP